MVGVCRAEHRVFLLDYDGTLVQVSSISSHPTPEVIAILASLCANPLNTVYIISGRGRAELAEWFGNVVFPPTDRHLQRSA